MISEPGGKVQRLAGCSRRPCARTRRRSRAPGGTPAPRGERGFELGDLGALDELAAGLAARDESARYSAGLARRSARSLSACDGTREVGDLLPRVAIVHAAIHPADPVPDAPVLNLQEVRQVRRAHVEARVGGAEQEPQLALASGSGCLNVGV